jgi:Leu/Phe-tRNA-protein transferase
MDPTEHGASLWPARFRGLSVPEQARLATELSRQSRYLKTRPFAHSGADARALADRMVAKSGGGLNPHPNPAEPNEFMWALCFDAAFVCRLAREGFLPMAGRIFADLICLLPKLHLARCLMVDLERDLVVEKHARRRARHYQCSVDAAFDGVIRGCQRQHGEHCWFYAPLTAAYRRIHGSNGRNGMEGGVRMHSVEVWDKRSGALVAGELGYAVGGIYTSLSGFRVPGAQSAGTIQCCCVAVLLRRRGFKVWDLGMGMDYKERLGARCVPRAEFLRLLRSVRDLPVTLNGVTLNGGADAGASAGSLSSAQQQQQQQQQQERFECRELLVGAPSSPSASGSAASAKAGGSANAAPSKKEAKRLRKKAAKAAAKERKASEKQQAVAAAAAATTTAAAAAAPPPPPPAPPPEK